VSDEQITDPGTEAMVAAEVLTEDAVERLEAAEMVAEATDEAANEALANGDEETAEAIEDEGAAVVTELVVEAEAELEVADALVEVAVVDEMVAEAETLEEASEELAAVESLEEAGFHVVVPQGHLCCGRPLYDYGMLDLAGAYLRKVLDTLRDEIRAGTPVVGVEPSCVAVFKDELLKLWPSNQDAKRLAKQTYHFSEFLGEHAADWEPPQLHRRALLHGHCHQQATGGTGPDRQLLQKMGAEVEVLDAGCCGMAGGWGYETGHYDVSVACGERALLPKVREAPAETLLVADGFSCRSQIEQCDTGRRALHAGQVLALAREHGPAGPPGPRPERAAPPRPQQGSRAGSAWAAAGIAAVAGAALVSRRGRQ